MAESDRKTSDLIDLFRSLANEPYRFDFFQALRRLECLSTQSPRLGESASPQEDPIRLGQEPSLAFAPSTLSALQSGKDGRPPRLLVHFMGLLGPNGPLPLHLTEFARDRLRNSDDPTFARFLDVFHHRMLSLFYRAWAVCATHGPIGSSANRSLRRLCGLVPGNRPSHAAASGRIPGLGEVVLRRSPCGPDAPSKRICAR